jgi:hypothetical protein
MQLRPSRDAAEVVPVEVVMMQRGSRPVEAVVHQDHELDGAGLPTAQIHGEHGMPSGVVPQGLAVHRHPTPVLHPAQHEALTARLDAEDATVRREAAAACVPGHGVEAAGDGDAVAEGDRAQAHCIVIDVSEPGEVPRSFEVHHSAPHMLPESSDHGPDRTWPGEGCPERPTISRFVPP